MDPTDDVKMDHWDSPEDYRSQPPTTGKVGIEDFSCHPKKKMLPSCYTNGVAPQLDNNNDGRLENVEFKQPAVKKRLALGKNQDTFRLKSGKGLRVQYSNAEEYIEYINKLPNSVNVSFPTDWQAIFEVVTETNGNKTSITELSVEDSITSLSGRSSSKLVAKRSSKSADPNQAKKKKADDSKKSGQNDKKPDGNDGNDGAQGPGSSGSGLLNVDLSEHKTERVRPTTHDISHSWMMQRYNM